MTSFISFPWPSRHSTRGRVAALAACVALAGCTTVGPDFQPPAVTAPADWNDWRSGDAALRIAQAQAQAHEASELEARWWTALGDAHLDRLEAEALAASPDLASAALRFAQARLQRDNVQAQGGPRVGLNAAATRQRSSEFDPGTRMADVLGGGNREQLVSALSRPMSLYQVGFDAAWEPDFWGRVRRSVEAADADVAQQAALLDLARLALVSEVARHYVELRTTQRHLALLQEDEKALGERMDILADKVRRGALSDFDLQRQRTELQALQAQRAPLLAQEAASIGQLGVLLGQPPGTLRAQLVQQQWVPYATLPDLRLGLPSELAMRRPDIRSAQAQLHRATAHIGVAQAALYPSIRLGARVGTLSYQGSEFGSWGSRMWSIGPSLDLPLFDRGQRQRTVQLRELQQQEAAIQFQKTVLQAWQEIDDALNRYAAEQLRGVDLAARVATTEDALQLAHARYRRGATDYLAVIDAQRSQVQARRDLVSSQGAQWLQFVRVNKALGNVDVAAP
ncbi:efflux transporter outer membrane subunit [Diaphorobacter sp.]|uniref:efflux transporter outer membrane subunit n=1 Tax=Diaphorobacter sp. TaxID=1934310 RepID=UPI0028A86AFE|nr:efflux transporter outer membrane subunit [Diaphorobacter sp.]